MILSAFSTSVSLCLGVAVLYQLVSGDPDLSEHVRTAAVDAKEKMKNAPGDDLHPEYEEFRSDSINMIDVFLSPTNKTLPNLRFRLFTKSNPKEDYNLQPNYLSIKQSPFNSKRKTIFITHGYLANLPKASVFYDLATELLIEGDYNVIVVDWTADNKGEYLTVTTRVPVVGFNVANLIHLLSNATGISAESVHFIGHSLGGQIAGYTGRATPNLGRITGLDAAGPAYQYLPGMYRLTYADALFVDGFHTNGARTTLLGIGTFLPYGHLDFFPNGGSLQAGCYFQEYVDSEKNVHFADTVLSMSFCSHERAPFLYAASVNKCDFVSVLCDSYDDYNHYEEEKCSYPFLETSKAGFHARPMPSVKKMSKFYFNTKAQCPFCSPAVL